MKKGCLITAIVILVILSLGLGYYFYQKSTKDPTIYATTQPEINDVIKKTVATGSIKPRKEVPIKPQVSGVVDELYVTEGQLVEKGQRLARIKLIPSEVNINSARSGMELARIRLKEAQRELERQQEVNKRNLDIETARVNYENAKQEEERQNTLFNDGIISEQDYSRYKLDLEVAKAALDNAHITSQNDLQRYISEVDIREQELQAAINNLQLLREGATNNSQQVSNIVTSTLDGMVLDIPVEEGTSVIERNTFNEGTSIAVVADMTNLIFEGKVDESEVGRLKEGMPIELTVGAIEDLTFDAVLERIAPQGIVDEGTVKFEIVAAIKPAEEIFLRAGYSASGDIILDRRDQVLTINERDLVLENDSAFVDVSTGDNTFERKNITTGLSDGIIIEVVEGLDTSTVIKMIKE